MSLNIADIDVGDIFSVENSAFSSTYGPKIKITNIDARNVWFQYITKYGHDGERFMRPHDNFINGGHYNILPKEIDTSPLFEDFDL